MALLRRHREQEGVVHDRPVERDGDAARRDHAPMRDEHRDAHPVARDEARLRQRDEYGGFNLGAAFFGWLVALGMAALLTALLSAAGAAIGLTSVRAAEATDSAGTIGIVGAAVLLLILALAYLSGGYVAGRMSRFDGARQGFGVWLLGLLVTIVIAVLGAVLGSEYNLLEQLNVQPRVPIDEGALTTGGAIALAAFVVVTIGAALLGGKIGERYHRKVDRAGYVA